LHIFGDLISFHPSRQIAKPTDVQPQVEDCLSHLECVLMKMKEKRMKQQKKQETDEKSTLRQKLPIIIIDNCNKLAEEEPRTLKSLQDFAKSWIDDQLAVFVFVSSEGKTEPIMKVRGVSSRMETLRIHELDKQNAIEFLESREIPKKDAEKIESITGGLFKYLDSAVDIYERTHGKTEDIQKQIDSELNNDYDKAQKFNSKVVVKKAVNELLKTNDKTLPKAEFIDSVFGEGMDPKNENFEELLKANVFSQENGVVRFQNRAMARYLEDNIMHEKKNKKD